MTMFFILQVFKDNNYYFITGICFITYIYKSKSYVVYKFLCPLLIDGY